jgi:predicted alpha/beta-fold hydrolase
MVTKHAYLNTQLTKKVTRILKRILTLISDTFIFAPEKVDTIKYDTWLKHENILTSDGETLDAFFYNSNKQPSYCDKLIFMYNHGSSGWVGSVLSSVTGKYLSNKGSVFVYDYRGFGKSTGKPSTRGCLKDSIEVYNFLVNDKKVDPKRIVLFGHSLGGCIVAYLMSYLLKHKKPTPRTMIIQNTFKNMQRICREISIFGCLVLSKLKTDEFIRYIQYVSHKNDEHKINMCVIHCEDDTLVNCQHSKDLVSEINNEWDNDHNCNHTNIKFIMIKGTHDVPIYDCVTDDFFVKMCKYDD